MIKLFVALVLSSLLAPITQAQEVDSLFIKRIADEMLVNGKAYENLRYLTKQIGGRLAGSPQMVKVCREARSKAS